MDVKLKNEIDFEKFYQYGFSDTVTSYYDELKKKYTPEAITVGVVSLLQIAIGIFVKFWFVDKHIPQYAHIYVAVVAVWVVAVALVFLGKKLDRILSDLNNRVLKDLICFATNNKSEDVTFDQKLRVSKDAIKEVELFNLDLLEYNGQNYTKFRYNNNMFVFSDINVYYKTIKESKRTIYKYGKKYIRTYKTVKKKNIFDGIYIGATLNKKNATKIYLIPNNLSDTVLQGKITNYIKFKGEEAILENLEFSKKYKVFCDDGINARYILSFGLMDKINQLDDVFKEKKYIVFKEGTRFCICIEGITIESIKKHTLPALRNTRKEKEVLFNKFKEINKLLSIYYILDLGNDLYTKNIVK